MLYTLLYLEVIKKPLTMASQVAQMNGKKNGGEGRQPLLNLKTAITKKNRQMQRERKPLNINKWLKSSFNPALTNRSSKPVKPLSVLKIKCRHTYSFRMVGPSRDQEWCKCVSVPNGWMHTDQSPGRLRSTLLDHLVASRCRDWAAARMGWLTGWLVGINSSSGS